MTVRQPRYSKEERARRGNDIYEHQIRPQVEAGNQGKIVPLISRREPSRWRKTSSRLPTACWLTIQMCRYGLSGSAIVPSTASAPTA
jgi:hypothetical protein